MRIETARILRILLAKPEAITNYKLADELERTVNNVHKRTTDMHNQRLICRELRYVPKQYGRTKIFHLWISLHGKNELTAYEARRLKRPSVLQKITKQKVVKLQGKIINSVFTLGETL